MYGNDTNSLYNINDNKRNTYYESSGGYCFLTFDFGADNKLLL